MPRRESRHGFTPAMSFYEKYPDCVSDTKKHPTAKAVGCFFGGPCVLWRENPLRRSGAKRADCHDCTAPVREPTDTRRNECAVGTLKKFANLSPHISVRSPYGPPKQYNPNLVPIGHGFGFIVFVEEVEDW